ncbi:MAG: hypothetical protein EPN37_16630 [Chitinophagaceae bacterium]|nr:MAG: hypothetical protein EPN37_16630 [Chitinophagaceae bacterium]
MKVPEVLQATLSLPQSGSKIVHSGRLKNKLAQVNVASFSFYNDQLFLLNDIASCQSGRAAGHDDALHVVVPAKTPAFESSHPD